VEWLEFSGFFESLPLRWWSLGELDGFHRDILRWSWSNGSLRWPVWSVFEEGVPPGFSPTELVEWFTSVVCFADSRRDFSTDEVAGTDFPSRPERKLWTVLEVLFRRSGFGIFRVDTEK